MATEPTIAELLDASKRQIDSLSSEIGKSPFDESVQDILTLHYEILVKLQRRTREGSKFDD